MGGRSLTVKRGRMTELRLPPNHSPAIDCQVARPGFSPYRFTETRVLAHAEWLTRAGGRPTVPPLCEHSGCCEQETDLFAVASRLAWLAGQTTASDELAQLDMRALVSGIYSRSAVGAASMSGTVLA